MSHLRDFCVGVRGAIDISLLDFSTRPRRLYGRRGRKTAPTKGFWEFGFRAQLGEKSENSCKLNMKLT